MVPRAAAPILTRSTQPCSTAAVEGEIRLMDAAWIVVGSTKQLPWCIMVQTFSVHPAADSPTRLRYLIIRVMGRVEQGLVAMVHQVNVFLAGLTTDSRVRSTLSHRMGSRVEAPTRLQHTPLSTPTPKSTRPPLTLIVGWTAPATTSHRSTHSTLTQTSVPDAPLTISTFQRHRDQGQVQGTTCLTLGPTVVP